MASAPDDSIVLIEGPWTHRKVRANGIALHVAELGAGPMVLMLHGFPQFWWTWRQQMIDLADAGFRAVAVDLRGYGSSDKPPRGYDVPTLAADIAALVTSLGEQDAVIVGSDVGGLLAWTIAATHPQVVRRIAVLGAAHPLRLREAIRPRIGRADNESSVAPKPDRGRRQQNASAYALRHFQVPRRPESSLTRNSDYVRSLFQTWTGPRWRGTPEYEADVERYAEAMRIPPVAHCSLELFRWLVRSIPRGDGRRYAQSLRQSISAPVLHLHGDFDGCVLTSTAQGSGRYVSGAYEWRLLDGVGHYPQNEAPELVSGELIRWAKLG
ncbi:pimeloyl-ACP methyl ester carboxylesterase [Jatrophihabitans sp. GAS493]|uniref:alpha/beta fold hydrolase n=1 Tax=Jatrophihabitans sp. GAS493 TaxID=1907575 RepID=UPI000BB86565|nr:alpha/beta hydrolase [Jatrophihabitans sp. GAS493]SOD71896.1 pimeloyl-ACP methyl ester carboxylesterase [Jatrophihabitans sp. GAS493]